MHTALFLGPLVVSNADTSYPVTTKHFLFNLIPEVNINLVLIIRSPLGLNKDHPQLRNRNATSHFESKGREYPPDSQQVPCMGSLVCF